MARSCEHSAGRRSVDHAQPEGPSRRASTASNRRRRSPRAMKMVAASKLRRAQQQAEAARPYAERMERMLGALAASVAGRPTAPPLLVGTGKDQVHLLIAVTADRGLAGAFNANDRPAARATSPAGWRPKARRSRSSPSAARAATTCAASSPAGSSATSAMPASSRSSSPTPARSPTRVIADAGRPASSTSARMSTTASTR